MSYTDFKAFSNQAVALDVDEKIELITILVKSLPQKKTDSNKEQKIKKINSILAKIPESEQLAYADVGLNTVREALKNDTW
ncbi:MAG: hypothetical protein ACI4MA_05985 [Treponema sp.]